ncbi:MAG TPA: hypothetical protein VEM95_01700 [Thermoplasmata archaeon]|nr:hypothetical protein [Thermoplasmata archaeon]
MDAPGEDESSTFEPEARKAFPWLQVGTPLGRTASAFLIAANFAFLFAPLLYLVNRLLNPGAYLDVEDPTNVAFALVTDPYGISAIGDLLVLMGGILLASALALVLLGLRRAVRRPKVDAFLLGGATVACLIGWIAANAYAVSRTRGVSGLDAVAATGGWSVAALLLVLASAAYVVFRIRAGADAPPHPPARFTWTAFAILTLLGSAILASWLRGSGDARVIVLELALRVVPIPLLGVLAYRGLWDDFAAWPDLDRPLPIRATDQSVGEVVGVLAGTETPALEDVGVTPPPPPDD